MNIRRKCEFFTQEFYLSLEGMDHFMEIQPQEQKKSNFFRTNDLAFHNHSMRLLSGKAEVIYFIKKENPWHYRQKT